jgi:hypothetical protein
LQEAIKKYNDTFGEDSRLKNMSELDSKFLQKRDTQTLKIELIKQLFVLELMKLLQLGKIELPIDTSFLQMLFLNRLFSLTLVVDKLLYAFYPPKSEKSNWDPQMKECVVSYAEAHEIAEEDINSLSLNRLDLEQALLFLLEKRSEAKYGNVTREIFSILIAYKIRNSSAHNIHAVELISLKFPEIFQSILEAIFIIVGQIPDSS